MAGRDETPAGGGLKLGKPWLLVFLALGLMLAGLVLASLGRPPEIDKDGGRDSLAPTSSLWVVLQLLAVAGGSLVSLACLREHFRSASWAFLDRLESSALLALVGMAGLLAWLGMREEWDSGRLFFGVAAGVALVAAVVVLLPRVGRHIAVSLLVVFHFCGMMTAFGSIDLPDGSSPWLPKQLWYRVYSPYLSFLYMTNAYHFYSPNPAAPSLLWFAVQYTDGTYAWVKIPDRANSPVGMHYQRMLALPEHCFVALSRLPLSQQELALVAEATGHEPNVLSWEAIEERRRSGSALPYSPRIPVVTDAASNLQYQEPTDNSKRLLASAAKHLFWKAQEEVRREGAGREVKSVKLYRVKHQVVTPAELAAGISPLDKTHYWAYFAGEFDGNGQIIDPAEPFLYWYLPITRVRPDYPEPYLTPLPSRPNVFVPAVRVLNAPRDGVELDCLESHARGYTRPASPKGEKK